MKGQEQGGRIINISSVAAQITAFKLTVYSTTESGLIQCTRSIAVEYAQKRNPLCDFSEGGGNRRDRFRARFRSCVHHDGHRDFPPRRHELII